MTTTRVHTSNQFDIELETVRQNTIRMGELALQQFDLAIQSLESGNSAIMTQALDIGYQVNNLEIEIDHKCKLILAQRQPEANDLRLILTLLKITTDLERIGDQSELIVHRAKMLYQRDGHNYTHFSEIARCASEATIMATNAMSAFTQSDTNIAAGIIRQDIRLNDEYGYITRSLICHMMEDPRSITAALDILFIAKAIERIGDHAKNIAEYVIFMVKGRDVRHASIEEMENQSL